MRTLLYALGSAAVFGAGARVVCHCANRTDPSPATDQAQPGSHRSPTSSRHGGTR